MATGDLQFGMASLHWQCTIITPTHKKRQLEGVQNYHVNIPGEAFTKVLKGEIGA